MGQDTLYSLFGECLKQKYINAGNDASYALRRDGGRLYIFFEHSNGRADWKNNLSYHPEPYSDMNPPWRCHGGFLTTWESVKPHIKAAVEDKTVSEVTVVGYSHGAALAVLCHEYIWFNRPDLREHLLGYGFGCPHVYYGRKIQPELKKRWENFFVIRNIDDIVTHLPPGLLGYRHIGQIIKIGRRFKYSCIGAHRAENYLAELKNDFA